MTLDVALINNPTLHYFYNIKYLKSNYILYYFIK